MAVKIKFTPLPGAQKEVFYDDRTGLLIFSGGLGSGKTYVLCMKALKLSRLNRGISGGFLCPDMKMFKKDVLPTFADILDRHKVRWKYHQTDHYFTFPWTKGKLYVFSGEKEIAGPNLGYCLVNEFSLIREVRIKEMIRRVRVKRAKFPQKVFGGTPEDKFGWLEDFIEAREKLSLEGKGSFKLCYGNTDDNTHLIEGYGDDLEGMLDEQALKVFKSGQIVKLGSDYFYYSWTRANVRDDIKRVPGLDVHVALDFNVGKMCASFWNRISVTSSGKPEIHCFSEIELTGNSNTTSMGMYIINNYVPNMDGIQYDDWMKIEESKRQVMLEHLVITCDSAGKNRKTDGLSDVNRLKKMGFPTVRFKTVNPRMRRRQLMMNGLISHKRILVNPNCKKTIKDFEKVQQNRQDFTKVKDKDDKLTHFSDGVDYLIDYEFGHEFSMETSFENFKFQ